MTHTIVILDHDVEEVFVYPLTLENKDADIDEDFDGVALVKKLGHNPNNCQWMLMTGELSIRFRQPQ